jgi:hypothetical protein
VSEGYVYDRLDVKANWLCEYKILKNILKPYSEKFDCTQAKYVNVKLDSTFKISKHTYHIANTRNSIFYNSGINSKFQPPVSQNYWKRNFDISGTAFSDMYIRKIKNENIKMIADFNYRLLHNLLVTNKLINKGKANYSSACCVCETEETVEHMLYTCSSVTKIWNLFENNFKCKLNWKLLLLGYNYGSNFTNFIERNISFVLCSLYKHKIRCKMKGEPFSENGNRNSILYNYNCISQINDIKQSCYVDKIENWKKLLKAS